MKRTAGGALVLVLVVIAGCTNSPEVEAESEVSPTDVIAQTAPAESAESGNSGDSSDSTAPEGPFEVTPSQQEGPFYPVQKPTDRDNDLAQVNGLERLASGQILELSGYLFDPAGDPVAGATIEIWQTDSFGIYLHPQDPQVDSRDEAFQGYGETVTDQDGSWNFTTIDPGYYEPRPRHIHLKVLVDGSEILTSQIYFSDDPQAEQEDPALVAEVETPNSGDLAATHTLVVEQ